MKALLASVAFFLHLSLAAQVPIYSTVNPTQPDTLIFSEVKPDLKPTLSSRLRKFDSRENHLVTRSIAVLAAGSGIGIISYKFVDEPLKEFAQKQRCRASDHIAYYIQPLGRSSYLLPASGLVYVTGLSLRNPKLQRTGILLASSLLINDLVTSKLKNEFQRQRPDETSHNFYFEGGEGGRHHLSFPSAHTSTAFTVATTLATVYRNHRWVPPVAYGTAALVGLSRIHDNKHWATDVLAGVAVGFVTAKGTNFLLKQAENQLEKRKVNIYVLPKVSNGTTGLSLGGTF